MSNPQAMLAGVGLLMVCCSSSSVAAFFMSPGEKKDDPKKKDSKKKDPKKKDPEEDEGDEESEEDPSKDPEMLKLAKENKWEGPYQPVKGKVAGYPYISKKGDVPIIYTTTAQCGKQKVDGKDVYMKCYPGQCCSVHNWCGGSQGTTSAWCTGAGGKGGQPEFDGPSDGTPKNWKELTTKA